MVFLIAPALLVVIATRSAGPGGRGAGGGRTRSIDLVVDDGDPLARADSLRRLRRIGIHSDYWLDVFPAILLLSIDMSSAVAPLTTLVLTSFDGPHTATVSGINSTATRLGALITTALLGTVFIRRGEHLFTAFATVMLLGAIVKFTLSSEAPA